MIDVLTFRECSNDAHNDCSTAHLKDVRKLYKSRRYLPNVSRDHQISLVVPGRFIIKKKASRAFPRHLDGTHDIAR